MQHVLAVFTLLICLLAQQVSVSTGCVHHSSRNRDGDDCSMVQAHAADPLPTGSQDPAAESLIQWIVQNGGEVSLFA